MKHKMFTVYDSKVNAYNQPFFMRSRGEATRGWSDTVNDPKTNFNKHPEDFTLFELGEYDDENGVITQYEAKIAVGTALEYLKPIQQVSDVSQYLKKSPQAGVQQ